VYNQRGFKGITKDSSFQDVNYSSRFHYLSLPIYGNLQLVPRLALEFGAETSYFLNLGGKYGDIKRNGESNESVTNLDFGLIAGLSFELTDRLSLQGRYYRGLKDVFDVTFTDVNGTELDINPRFTNHGFQLSLTVFPF
jgi:opacity protein-like surface antigen